MLEQSIVVHQDILNLAEDRILVTGITRDLCRLSFYSEEEQRTGLLEAITERRILPITLYTGFINEKLKGLAANVVDDYVELVTGAGLVFSRWGFDPEESSVDITILWL